MGWAAQRDPQLIYLSASRRGRERERELFNVDHADPLRASVRMWLRETTSQVAGLLASCVIVSGFKAALDLDTYPLSTVR